MYDRQFARENQRCFGLIVYEQACLSQGLPPALVHYSSNRLPRRLRPIMSLSCGGGNGRHTDRFSDSELPEVHQLHCTPASPVSFSRNRTPICGQPFIAICSEAARLMCCAFSESCDGRPSTDSWFGKGIADEGLAGRLYSGSMAYAPHPHRIG